VPPLLPSDPEFRERIAALKHDLGKYVAWRSVNLPEDAWTGAPGEPLVDALVADVLSTMTRGDGSVAAWEVFDAHMSDVARPWPAPELARVDEAVRRLEACAPALARRDLPAIAECRAVIRDAQATIRRELAALHRRLVQAHDESQAESKES
jgi:hypothetical protein